MEKFTETDYAIVGGIINGLLSVQCYKGNSLQKSVVKMLLSIAKSDRERKCLQYAISSGMTPQAQRQYGFKNIQQNTKEVEAALADVQCIQEAIFDLASVERNSFVEILWHRCGKQL